MELAVVLIFFLLTLLFDFRLVLKRKHPQEIAFYVAVLLISIPILVLRSLGINLPDPIVFIQEAVKPFFTL